MEWVPAEAEPELLQACLPVLFARAVDHGEGTARSDGIHAGSPPAVESLECHSARSQAPALQLEEMAVMKQESLMARSDREEPAIGVRREVW